MKAKDKYREKYKMLDDLRGVRKPAGHDDILRLCDTVDSLSELVEDFCHQVGDDLYLITQNQLNMILLGL